LAGGAAHETNFQFVAFDFINESLDLKLILDTVYQIQMLWRPAVINLDFAL
jgi:hypothetical protein